MLASEHASLNELEDFANELSLKGLPSRCILEVHSPIKQYKQDDLPSEGPRQAVSIALSVSMTAC